MMWKKTLFLMVLPMVLLADKVGYVNMGKFFESYYKTVNANVLFEQKKKETQDKLQLMERDLEQAAREAQKAEEDTKNELLAQTARDEAMSRYRVRMEAFITKRDEFDRANRQAMNELRQTQFMQENALGNDLQEYVKNYAKEKGYTHIIDISGQTMNRMPLFIVFPENLEITEELIAGINAGHEEELKEAQKKLDALRAAAKNAPQQ